MRPLLLGHRGARANHFIPENTLASFEHAMLDGCDGFEFDVRLTADKRAIVCHDPNVNGVRVAGARRDDLPGVPTLEDVLSHFAERAWLDIELKVEGLESQVGEVLRVNKPKRGFVVSSFQTAILTTLRAEDPSLPLGLISDRAANLATWNQLPIAWVIPHYSLVTKILIDDVHKAGKRIMVWTVNDADRMVRYAAWGVDGLIADDTALLVKTLGA
jgi:glycerophosphoryl diester phosphodiesterase